MKAQDFSIDFIIDFTGDKDNVKKYMHFLDFLEEFHFYNLKSLGRALGIKVLTDENYYSQFTSEQIRNVRKIVTLN